MKLRYFVSAFAVVAVLAAPAQTAPAHRSTAPVVDFTTLAPVEGAWGSLVRTASGLSATFHTAGLPVGNAFTVWFVVFNNPEACTDPIGSATNCGEGDLFDPEVAAAVFRAGGHVIGGGTRAAIAGRLNVGQTRDALAVPDGEGGFVTPFATLMNPLGAEVHLVLLNHGPWVPGSPELFQTFFTCNPDCTDWQAAIFLPPTAG